MKNSGQSSATTVSLHVKKNYNCGNKTSHGILETIATMKESSGKDII